MLKPLLGFADFFDEVGAVKPPGGKPVRSAPGKSAPGKPGTPAPAGAKSPTARTYSPPKQTKNMKYHGAVLVKAKKTLLKAARGLGRAQMLLAKRPPTAVTARAATAMRTAGTQATVARQAAVQAQRTPTRATQRAATFTRGVAAKSILGAVEAMVGAKKPIPPGVAKNLSPKAKAAVAKHNAALEAARKAAQALAKNTLKAKKSVQKLAKAAINQKKVAKALRTKRGRTAVGELLADQMIGDLLADPMVGAEAAEMIADYCGMTDGDVVGRKVYTGPNSWVEDDQPGPDVPYVEGSTPLYAEGPDGLIAPTGTGTDPESLLSEEDLSALSADDDSADMIDILNASKDLPPFPLNAPTELDYKAVGGVLYNESKGRPNGFIGSHGLMMRETDKTNAYRVDTTETEGTDHFGYVWGQYEADGPEKGVRWGAELTPNSWNYIHGARTVTDKHGWADKVDESKALASVRENSPMGKPFGPIIGNPALADFNGIRMDAQGNLFWYPQEAPDWVTAPLRQAAALTEAAEKKAAEDEKAQYALEQEKLRRDEAATQAAAGAAAALAESAAVSEGKITATQETTKQMQESTAQAQQETAYQQTLVEQAKGEAASEQQAAQQILEQAKAEGATEQQAQQLLLARAQRQEQLLAETPELEAALMAQDAGLLEESAEEEGGEEPSYDDTAAYSEPEDESDKFRHPSEDDDYEASGFEDDSEF
jgi:hypothetical protein